MATRQDAGWADGPQEVRGEGAHTRYRKSPRNRVQAPGPDLMDGIPDGSSYNALRSKTNERFDRVLSYTQRELGRLWDNMTGFRTVVSTSASGVGLPENLDQNGNIVSFTNEGQNVPMSDPYNYTLKETAAMSCNAQRRSGSLTALGKCPAISFNEGADHTCQGVFYLPDAWRREGTIEVTTMWSMGTINSATTTIIFTLKASGPPDDFVGAETKMYENTISTIAQAAIGFDLQEHTEHAGMMDLSNKKIMWWEFKRLHADAGDTYTGNIYYVGGTLKFVPKGQI